MAPIHKTSIFFILIPLGLKLQAQGAGFLPGPDEMVSGCSVRCMKD